MSKRLGLVVRSDFGGGLANQSYECWRWLAPDTTLVVLMGDRGRGTPERFERYDPAYLVHYLAADAQHNATIEEFLSKVDVVLSIETFYEPFLVNRAEQLGVERVLYANPELLNENDPAEKADRYLWPAEWVQEFPQPGEILPWPCSTDIEPRTEINWPPRFVHVGCPAMLDRNGTQVVEEAAQLTRSTYDLTFYGRACNRLDGADYRDPPDDLWDLYRDADLLILPRRYGCLSLPMLEAAALGVPTLTTDLLPQSAWFAKWAPWLLVGSGDAKLFSMKGSQQSQGKPGVAVHQPSPAALAVAMDRLADRADVLDALRVEVRTWAEARSWAKLKPLWDAALR